MIRLKEKNRRKAGGGVPEIRPDMRLNELFDLVIGRITSELKYPRAVIMLEDPETGDFTIVTHSGLSRDFAEKYRRSPNWAIGKVLWENIASIFYGENRSCREYREIRLEHDFISAICAPIVYRNTTLGYIHCEHDKLRFDEQALRFVSSMAKLCSYCDKLEERTA